MILSPHDTLKQYKKLSHCETFETSNIAFRRNISNIIETHHILMGKEDSTLPSMLHRNINSAARG